MSSPHKIILNLQADGYSYKKSYDYNFSYTFCECGTWHVRFLAKLHGCAVTGASNAEPQSRMGANQTVS